MRYRQEAIDAARLKDSLRDHGGFDVDAVEVFPELESTNRYLLEHPPARSGALRVCIAEFQTRGRGRRGREWRSPPSAGLCLSAGWIFPDRPADPATITLATGVVARGAIEALTGVSTGLKWPNDLLWQSRKLAGILVELDAKPGRGSHVVIGIGINVDLSDETLASIGTETYGAVDIRTAASGVVPDRTLLAASLCSGFGELFGHYGREGFARYREAWRHADLLLDTPITVQRGEAALHGTARGIDDEGALLVLDSSGCVHRVISGDVSVRPA